MKLFKLLYDDNLVIYRMAYLHPQGIGYSLRRELPIIQVQKNWSQSINLRGREFTYHTIGD